MLGNQRAYIVREDTMRRDINLRSELDRVELPLGPIYSFMPAHGGSRAGAVAEQLSRTLSEVPGFSVLLAGFAAHKYSLWNPADSPRRLDGQTWGAFVFDSHGLEVLDAREVYPRQLRKVLEYAQRKYRIVCADVSEAKESHSLETLRASECIFIVSHSDRASLEMAREKREWLQSIDMAEQCGLLLDRVPGGMTSEQAEDLTGLPMCSLVDRSEYLQRLSGWLVAEETYSTEPVYALVN
jgi:Flp pilus assembly CpaE family ATPase